MPSAYAAKLTELSGPLVVAGEGRCASSRSESREPTGDGMDPRGRVASDGRGQHLPVA